LRYVINRMGGTNQTYSLRTAYTLLLPEMAKIRYNPNNVIHVEKAMLLLLVCSGLMWAFKGFKC